MYFTTVNKLYHYCWVELKLCILIVISSQYNYVCPFTMFIISDVTVRLENVNTIGLKKFLLEVGAMLLCPGVTDASLQSQAEIEHDQWFREILFEGRFNCSPGRNSGVSTVLAVVHPPPHPQRFSCRQTAGHNL